jgi:hypothetical protein
MAGDINTGLIAEEFPQGLPLLELGSPGAGAARGRGRMRVPAFVDKAFGLHKGLNRTRRSHLKEA